MKYLNFLFIFILTTSQANPDMDSTVNSAFGITLGDIKPESQDTGYADQDTYKNETTHTFKEGYGNSFSAKKNPPFLNKFKYYVDSNKKIHNIVASGVFTHYESGKPEFRDLVRLLTTTPAKITCKNKQKELFEWLSKKYSKNQVCVERSNIMELSYCSKEDKDNRIKIYGCSVARNWLSPKPLNNNTTIINDDIDLKKAANYIYQDESKCKPGGKDSNFPHRCAPSSIKKKAIQMGYFLEKVYELPYTLYISYYNPKSASLYRDEIINNAKYNHKLREKEQKAREKAREKEQKEQKAREMLKYNNYDL